MVVKILTPSNSFNAIDYNADRINKGEATFLGVRNMGAFVEVCQNIWDYKRFLEKWTSRNSNIKNGQFHVTISCKGREYTAEELQTFAEKWLQLMGYEENPVLFFFHQNTKNNHIHLVTSRIDKNGKKINDSFENERSLKAMKSIMGEDLLQNVRNTIGKSLRYSYSSVKQFSMILEELGYKVNTDENGLNIKKHGFTVFLKNELIEYSQRRYYKELSPKQKYKQRAIFDKYSKKLGKDEFVSFMRKNFGLSVVFFGKKDSPYGYAVIDHKNHIVIHGKDIIPVKKLLANLTAEKNVTADRELCLDIIRIKLKENEYISEYQINRYLYKYDMFVKNGILTDKFSQESINLLSPEEVNLLKRNNILSYIRNTYDPQTPGEYRFLCHKYRIEENDLKIVQSNSSGKRGKDNIDLYRSLLMEAFSSADTIDVLKNIGIEVIKENNEFIIYDRDNDVLFSNITLGLDYNMFENLESYGYRFMGSELDDGLSGLQENLNDLVDSITDFVTPTTISTSESPSPRKRKKR